MPRRFVAIVIVVHGTLTALAFDVFSDAKVAQQRMHQLQLGYAVFLNDHDGKPPEDLSELYPDYVEQAVTFWHPGDADPPPETIDNAVPNAPNSARISFDWVLTKDYVMDDPFIADNTPENNAGQFVSFVTVDGVVETDPPNATPTPTRVALARAHLRRLGQAMLMYANDNHERLPDDLLRLWDSGLLQSPRSFWNPGDADPLPDDINNSEPNGKDSARVSFDFPAAGMGLDEIEPDTIVVIDNTSDNNDGYGVLVLTGDWKVTFVPDCVGDVSGDDRVGPGDLRTLLRNYGRRDSVTPSDGDTDADGDVDYRDLVNVLTNYGSSCTPGPSGNGGGVLPEP
ncbi:MAG: hypothetical protein CHACPFDD_00599 [Phycisphaerae bacterium]|nr:hypothetical protein [Phycisphaerae bacterium]